MSPWWGRFLWLWGIPRQRLGCELSGKASVLKEDLNIGPQYIWIFKRRVWNQHANYPYLLIYLMFWMGFPFFFNSNVFTAFFMFQYSLFRGFPGGASGKEFTCHCKRHKRHGCLLQVRKISWSRKWQLALVVLLCKIPWTEEPVGLQSIGSQRIRHDWATKSNSLCFLKTCKKCSLILNIIMHF